MFQNSLDNKPVIVDANGEKIKDLTASMFGKGGANVISFSLYRVPMGYEMRPDLISQSAYNNTLYAEYILKYNGISNPFTIGPNDVILIPDLDSAKNSTENRTETTGTSSDRTIRDSYKYIDPTKVPAKDSNIVNFDNRLFRDPDKVQDGALPPNIAPEGEKNITYRNGRVYFGEGIGESACLTNGMTNSEFLTKIIKSQ